MAHKTLIGGTAYNVVGGTTLVSGTSYRISAGKTLVGGTGYSLPFGASTVPYSLDDWPGWSNATWEDINNLCYAKQQGYINSWPADVVLGATKSETLSSAVLGTTTHDVMIIGIDIDGDGTLTFQTKNCLADTVAFGGSGLWSSSTARIQCQNYYNAFPGKDYILTVSKLTSTSDTTADLSETSDAVWIPSRPEVGGSSSANTEGEFTVGSSTPYNYSSNADRIKKLVDTDESGVRYWLRSRHQNSSNSVDIVYDGGSISYVVYSDAVYLAPAFVIGNPLAQTIE